MIVQAFASSGSGGFVRVLFVCRDGDDQREISVEMTDKQALSLMHGMATACSDVWREAIKQSETLK